MTSRIRNRSLPLRAGIVVSLVVLIGLLAVAQASAEPHLTVELEHTPTSLPRNFEQLTYLLKVENTATANPSLGDTLTCNGVPAEWHGSHTWFGKPVAQLGFTYQWVRNGMPILGATGSVPKGGPLPTYTVSPTDAGATIQCIVTGTVTAANPVESVSTSYVSQPSVVVEPQPAVAPPSGDSTRTTGAIAPVVSVIETSKRLCKPPTGWTTSATATTAVGSNVLTAVATAAGTGTFVKESKTVTGLVTNGGVFRVGQTITSTTAGIIPAGTTIAAVGNGTLELSAAALLAGSSKTVTAGSQPFAVGQSVSGAGIPAGTTITGVNEQTLTLSANATVSATEVVISSASAPAIGTWKNYRWLRNGSMITGATSETYEPLIASAKTTSGSSVLTEVITTKGTGTLSSGSTTVTGVTTSLGSFLVGQTLSGEGIPAGATVVAVGAGTIELSAAATASGAKSISGGALPFAIGQVVTGPGIPAGATVTAVGAQTITLSANATSSATGSAVSATAPAIATVTSGSNTITVVTSATGTGTLASGNKSVTGLSTTTGVFLVGQPISGTGIPAGTTIAAVGAGTLELSAAATASGSPSLSAGSAQPFAVGQAIGGAGIPAGATITAVSGSNLTLSANATASGTGVLVWGRTAGPDNNTELQCEITSENAGGSAIGTSRNTIVGAKPLGIETEPSAGETPTVELANATNGTVTLQLELPAGEETAAFEVYALGGANGTTPQGWACTKQAATLLEHARVTCTRSDSLGPQKAFPGIAVSTTIGADAPDPLVATASLTGGGSSAPAPAMAEFNFAPAVPFGIASLATKVADSTGNNYTQAGGHPFSASAAFEETTVVRAQARLNNGGTKKGLNYRSVESTRDVLTDLPAGFIGNPSAVIQPCASLSELMVNTYSAPSCPPSSAVGSVEVFESQNVTAPDLPIFLVKPGYGQAALLEFVVPSPIGYYPVALVPELRPDRGYALRLAGAQVPQATNLEYVSATVCSYGERLRSPLVIFYQKTGFPEAAGCMNAGEAGALSVPFLTDPTECANAAPLTTVSIDSWEHPGVYAGQSAQSPQATGCKNVPFSPKIALQPTSHQADSPTGLDVSLLVPSEGLENPAGVAQADLKRAVVSLPVGMSVNPSAAGGLGACTQAQLGMVNGVPNDEPVRCPDSSKIGSVEVFTPLLEGTLHGSVFLAEQGDNPFHSLLALYLVVEMPERGILVKIPGKVEADPRTGQLKATFDNNPQVPFSSLSLHFNSGGRAPLLNPPSCGSYGIVSELSPWSAKNPDAPTAEETRTSTSTFQASSGPGGGACPAGALEPKLTAGVQNAVAGSTSPFVLDLSREDGTQRFSSLNVTLPPGLLGYLKGIPECSDGVLAGISTAEGTGAAQAVSPSCPSGSLLGTVSVGVGGGSNPYYVNTGRVYLAGPYEGAPFSIVIVTPAVAGPFDLGNVVVRSALLIDRRTAQVTVKSDPIPMIVHGIPVDVRDIRVNINRPGFIVAPTDCKEMGLSTQVTGEKGASTTVSDRFQVGECASLAFKPSFTASTSANTSRGRGASLTVKVAYPKQAEANIAKVKVQLPKKLPSRLTTLQKACTEAQFDTNPAGCPAASVVGSATALTPLLSAALTGPAYFVSHGGAKFPELIMVLQGEGIKIELAGETFIDKHGITTSTFNALPDAPVSSFQLNLPQGPDSALAAPGGKLCQGNLVMPTTITGHNGAVITQNTKIAVTGCTNTKTLTNSQKLANALKACKKLKNTNKRTHCETTARKKYGPKSKAGKTSTMKKGDTARR